MHRLLVALHDGMVPVLVVGGVVAPRLVLRKSPLETLKEASAPDLLHQGRNILRHEEGEPPGVTLDIVVVGPAAEGIEAGSASAASLSRRWQ